MSFLGHVGLQRRDDDYEAKSVLVTQIVGCRLRQKLNWDEWTV